MAVPLRYQHGFGVYRLHSAHRAFFVASRSITAARTIRVDVDHRAFCFVNDPFKGIRIGK